MVDLACLWIGRLIVCASTMAGFSVAMMQKLADDGYDPFGDEAAA